MTEILTTNFHFLQRFDPKLLHELEGISDEAVSVSDARKHGLTMSLSGRHVCSPYDPLKEANKAVRGEKQMVHIHFGFALGHLLEEDKPFPGGTVVVWEPCPALLLAAMKVRPLEPLLSQFPVVICTDPGRLAELLGKAMKGDAGFRIICNPFHQRTWPDQLAFLEKIAKRAHFNSVVALKTIEKNSPQLTMGALKALPYSTRLPGVEHLAGKLKDKPAVIVSAGPSLEQNLAELAPYKEKVVIIAIGRTASILERWDIEPHFLLHNEPKPFFKFIEKCGNLGKTAFILSLQAELAYYQFPHGQTFVFQNPANFTGRWLAQHYPKLEKQGLDTGGSVSTEAFSFAVLAGCNPIAVIGQDLAIKGDRYYGHNEGEKFLHGARENLRVPGYFGAPVTTVTTYYSYALWFGEAAARCQREHPGLKLVNATEGGVALEHFVPMKLRHYLWQYAREPIDLSETIEQAASLPESHRLTSEELARFTDWVDDGLKATIELYREFVPLEEKLNKRLDQGFKLQTLGRELDRLYEFKQRYVAIQKDLLVLSGFMQAELLAFKRQRTEQEAQAGSDERRLTKVDLTHFAKVLKASHDAAVKMQEAIPFMKRKPNSDL